MLPIQGTTLVFPRPKAARTLALDFAFLLKQGSRTAPPRLAQVATDNRARLAAEAGNLLARLRAIWESKGDFCIRAVCGLDEAEFPDAEGIATARWIFIGSWHA